MTSGCAVPVISSTAEEMRGLWDFLAAYAIIPLAFDTSQGDGVVPGGRLYGQQKSYAYSGKALNKSYS